MSPQRHIIVIGGGITGLAAAHRLQELSADGREPLRVTLFEAADRLGGAIRTIRHDDYLIELGPDNFITNKPGAIALCKRIGLEAQLLKTNDQNRRALVVRRGRLVPIPEGFELMAPRNMYAMAASPIFSLRGKLRMWCERFVKSRKVNEDESLESFVLRRFGREALDRLIQPLIGGIYTADPATLSLRATVPRFLDMETRHGSITAAMRHEKKERRTAAKSAPTDAGARYSLFVTLREGMERLTDALRERLRDAARVNTRVDSLERREMHGWTARLSTGESLDADAVLLATPPHAAGALLQPLDAPLARMIGGIECASSAIVVAGYRREDVRHRLDAFGFVVPHLEGRSIIAGSFSHVKYAGRAPSGHVLLRAFVGGAMQPRMLDHGDVEMEAIVRREFEQLLGITAPPLFTHVQRWPRSMPQYKVGHVKRVEAIRAMAAQHPGLELAGSAFDGVGIPDCISSAEAAADRLARGV
jgi:oxygen-dependent protoporphyrinogen oxidase